ncbi:MAG: LuxR C-terminal-related transcriptional regulator [Actinomycetota bacterium]
MGDRAPTTVEGRPLLAAKLTVPRVPGGAVRRERPAELIEGCLERPLTVVVAPAGSGKTTLLAMECPALPASVAWATLDGGDVDPVRCWSYVIEALERAKVIDGGAVRRELVAGPIDGTERAIALLLARIEAAAIETVLVLDDLQAVRSGPVPEQLGDFVRLAPPNLHVVLASRVDPPFPLSRLRARDQLVEVRTDDLAFSTDEAAALLRDTVGVDLEPAELARVVERTEGWAAGLYLAGLSLRSHDDRASFLQELSGVERHLVDYLTEEVLEAQPPELHRFLLRTSVLDELSGPACDAVLETTGSVAVLRQLEEESLFVVPLDGERTAWRYHQLLADVLRSRLAETPELAAELHRRAGDHHDRTGSVTRAIHHAIAAGDHAVATDRILASWLRYTNAGRQATVWGWVEALSDDQLLRSVELCAMAGWAKLNLGQYDAIEEWVREAERDAGTGSFVDAATIRSHRERHLGRTDTAVEWGREAVGRAGDDTGPHAAAAAAAAGVAAFWAAAPEAAELLERVAVDATEQEETSSFVMASAYLAMMAADRGDHDTALIRAGAALANCETEELERHHLPAMAHLALASVAIDDGRLREAGIHLADAMRLAIIAREPHQRVRIDLLAARLAHRLGDSEEARSRLRAALRRSGTLRGHNAVAELVRDAANELRFAPRPDHDALPPGARDLTDRELEVLRLLPSGLTRAELAEELCVSINTVKTHLTAIGRKLGAAGRADVLDRARELGLI